MMEISKQVAEAVRDVLHELGSGEPADIYWRSTGSWSDLLRAVLERWVRAGLALSGTAEVTRPRQGRGRDMTILHEKLPALALAASLWLSPDGPPGGKDAP